MWGMGIATIAAYALIAFCRLIFTPNEFKNSKFGLGMWAKPFYVVTFVWNCIVFAVSQSMPFDFVRLQLMEGDRHTSPHSIFQLMPADSTTQCKSSTNFPLSFCTPS